MNFVYLTENKFLFFSQSKSLLFSLVLSTAEEVAGSRKKAVSTVWKPPKLMVLGLTPPIVVDDNKSASKDEKEE